MWPVKCDPLAQNSCRDLSYAHLPAVILLGLSALQCGSSWYSTRSFPWDVKVITCVEADGESQTEVKVHVLAAVQGFIYGGSLSSRLSL